MSAKAPSRGRKAGRGRGPVGRTAELARKRERRSVRLRLAAFSGVLVLLVLLAGYQFWLRDSSLVGVKDLQVVGVDTGTKEGKQIDAAVRTAMGEMTTLHLKPEALDQELARFPRVAGAEIDASFPNAAKVTVTVREDGSVLGEGSQALLVATDGMVLGPADVEAGSLPRIEGGAPAADAKGSSEPDEAEPPAAGAKLSGKALRQALILGAVPAELRSLVEQSETSPEGIEVRFDEGPTMLFGDPSHVDEKWRAAASLIADPSFDLSGYVDLTVPRRPAVSAEEPTEESEEESGADTAEEPVTG